MIRPATPMNAGIAGTAVVGGVLAVVAGLALLQGGGRPGRLEAVAFAAAVTGCGSIAGWWASRRATAAPAAALGGAIAASALRTAPPLAGLAWLAAGGRNEGTADAAAVLVVFYLSLLATTIFLEIMWGPAAPRAGARPPACDRTDGPGI